MVAYPRQSPKALVKPDGLTIVSEFGLGGVNSPKQESDISFGTFGSPPQTGYFDSATKPRKPPTIVPPPPAFPPSIGS